MKKNKGFKRSYTIQSNKSTSYKSSIANNMLNSVINLFNKDKDKEKDKNSSVYKNLKSEMNNTERGKHLCTMYWCEEHFGINSNEKIIVKSNNLNDLIGKDSTTNIQRYKSFQNQTNTKCSSCNII
jgi:hypothetical protein